MNFDENLRTLEGAVAHSRLGYPPRVGGLKRLLLRVFGRVLWPFAREQIEFNNSVASLVYALNTDLRDLGQITQSLQRANDNFENAFDNVDASLEALEDQNRLWEQRLDLVIRQSFLRYHEGVGALQREVGEFSMRLEDALRGLDQSVSEKYQVINDAVRRVNAELVDARFRVSQVDLFLNQVKRSMPQPPRPEILASLPSALENLYPSFEELLRGPESLVADRERAYIDDIQSLVVPGRILDLGCGRGEWLELLQDIGEDAYGLEINEQFVTNGKSRGLDIRHGDVIDHLENIPPSELKAVSALHLAEHLEIETLITMIDLCLRALRPGGLLLIETPNPENLSVGAWMFYLDPTHTHPLPPALLSFLVNSRGFDNVEIRRLRRSELIKPEIGSESPWSEDIREIWNYLQTNVAGPEDYALLARRP